ncbi:MAG TPA: HAMP domain-containing sensor histidine kinase, partial [Gemmatimonadaceae bacterium]
VATTVRGERFTVTGGSAFDSARVGALSTDPSVLVAFSVSREPRAESPKPRAERPEPPAITPLPYIWDSTGAEPEAARIALIPDPAPMQALKADIARWLAIAMTLTLLVAALVAALFGRFISAPVIQLAERTTKLERVAAMGDLARQVNHDIKNGLAPIRNVLRHLTQAAESAPETLATIYGERRATLDAGMEYLDQLARNYAKLSPALSRGHTDARAVIREVARQANGGGAATVDVRVPESLPSVRADAVVLHRILDNLVSNAVDALDGRPGSVTIAAEAIGQSHAPSPSAPAHNGSSRTARSQNAQPHNAPSHNASLFVRLTVTDTGRGMSRDELDRAFNDFYTTKPSGTGLGLSVVRRLLTDVGGSLRAESAPGKGSTFTVEIPATSTRDAK